MRISTFAHLAREVLARPARLGEVRLVAVDGPTGSGKSTFARRLAAALGDTATRLCTDDLLDGWADTVTFWPRLEEHVLSPILAGRDGAYRRYDWTAGRFTDETTLVPAGGVLLVDGVTSARRAARPLLTLAVWMDVPFEASLARAIARDGPAAAGELRAWHERERAHFAEDGTAAHADLLVDGAPTVPHDADREFVVRRPPGTAGCTHD
ncbi:MAG: AAA family ATPase [Streptosporangiales bacterium]|nr:AAA family ATPase [Streptosporangiales bacterium]